MARDHIHQAFQGLLRLLKARATFMVSAAYFDESGTDAKSPVMCVAGYLFNHTQVSHLDREWGEVLTEFGIDHFHMADCAHGVGLYRDWGVKRRDDLSRRLIGIIKRRMLIGIAVSISERDFEKLKPAEWKHGGAYTICLNYCLTLIGAWAEYRNYRIPIAYFFEAGHRQQGVTEQSVGFLFSNKELAFACRHHSHAFADKRAFRGLQASDIFAWELHQQQKRDLGLVHRKPRLSFLSLCEQAHYWAHFTAENLDWFFKYGQHFVRTGKYLEGGNWPKVLQSDVRDSFRPQPQLMILK